MASPAAPTLPVVSLRGKTIDPSIVRRVSLETMQRYQVGAFEETPTELKLAIVYPEQLKQGFFTALKDMESKVGRTIKLFRTDPASFGDLLKQYPKEMSSAPVAAPKAPQTVPVKAVSEPAPPPPLFKIGKSVALNYLKRVPVAYAKVHRIASVDFFPPNTYWFAVDTSSAETDKLITEIAKANDITIHQVQVSTQELDDLLAYYEAQAELEKIERKEETVRKMESTAPVDMLPMEIKPEKKLAEGVVVPDVQAAIISTEEEKGGIAGLFQRVAQNFGAPSVEEVVQDKVVDTPPQPVTAPNIAPETGVSSRSAAVPAEMVRPEPAAPVEDKPVEGKTVTARGDEDETDIGKLLEGHVTSVEELKEHIRKGFIPRIVAAVVSFAIQQKASDIHIESFDDEVRVRYRVDGQLIDIVKLPPDVHAAMVSRIKILSRLRLDETRIPQDGRFDVTFNNTQVDVRVSVMPTVHGEKVVLRILDKSKGVTSLEKLGVEGLAYQRLMDAIQKPYGVCLATGPTGSGKSTTLYAVLNRIATPNVNVVTLEDPVEYEMKGINQSQIRPKIGFSFAEGLRSVLRQDPNIIMVGEIRDGETANMVTQAALTGHLVLSTLHTNDASGAIPRLSNMGIEPFLINSSLNVAIGQRLVRMICPHCKKEVALPPGFRAEIEEDLTRIAHINPTDAARLPKEVRFYQGLGCEQCGGKGYLGRMGIFEVLVMSEGIGELSIKNAADSDIKAQAQKEGMLTMYEDGLIKVANGVTTLDEVLRETSNK